MELDVNRWHPRTKAIVVTAAFAIAGLIGCYTAESNWPDVMPMLVFYTVLTINSYFSVKLFTTITPPDEITQRTLDLVLMAIYFLLAYSFDNTKMFLIITLFLFIVAPLKYSLLLLGKVPHPKLLKKKITIDLLGTLLAAAVIAGSVAGYTHESAWALAIIFTIANVYFLLIDPMYKIIDYIENALDG